MSAGSTCSCETPVGRDPADGVGTRPAGCAASLGCYLKITTAETGSRAHDNLQVKIGSTVVAFYSNLNATGAYVGHSVNLGAYAGQTVTLTYVGTEDGSLQTSFVLDDTSTTLS